MTTAARCVRLYADDKGDSHFDEIALPYTPVQYAPPAPPLDLTDPIAARQMRFLRFPQDWNDAAHPSPRRQLFVVLSGELEGWTSLGERRVFGPGDCLLMEDTTGKGHGARPLDAETTGLMITLD